uniref:Ribonuclease H-like domain, reverse transcriptase, RNA-dependent DNA polymerase n=1 Tax=Tanacetum cinerariifolium TaxID=118510 RepID=A0A6L2JNN1_TANCI|nr:ribonuclease H-like domain, reverse transcriptase, RNA-dependent DNA polymerase [Tanacetum cinerariifolium]
MEYKIKQHIKVIRFQEQAIYTKTSKDSTLLIGVYVDDLIITGTPKEEVEKFKAQMEEKFKMSDLGLLAYYLGIEVTQTNGDISIKQSAYVSKILKEAGMLDSNETLIPMDPGTRLTKITEGTMVNLTEYRSLIGRLRYLLHTRPDLSYSVGLLSRFMQEPREQHMKAIRQDPITIEKPACVSKSVLDPTSPEKTNDALEVIDISTPPNSSQPALDAPDPSHRKMCYTMRFSFEELKKKRQQKLSAFQASKSTPRFSLTKGCYADATLEHS